MDDYEKEPGFALGPPNKDVPLAKRLIAAFRGNSGKEPDGESFRNKDVGDEYNERYIPAPTTDLDIVKAKKRIENFVDSGFIYNHYQIIDTDIRAAVRSSLKRSTFDFNNARHLDVDSGICDSIEDAELEFKTDYFSQAPVGTHVYWASSVVIVPQKNAGNKKLCWRIRIRISIV